MGKREAELFRVRAESIAKMRDYLQQQPGGEDTSLRIAIGAKIRPGAAANYMSQSAYFVRLGNGRWRLKI